MDPPLAKLKLEALLSEVQVDYEQLEQSVNALVEDVKKVIMRIPEKEVKNSSVKGFLKDLSVPRSKCSLEFKKPESFTLVGSYCTRTMIQPDIVVDLALRIPKACFYQKDFLNHRYHAKRALYLAVIYKRLSNSKSFESIEWSFFRQDARKPVLIIRPASGSFVLRIIATISGDALDISKLVDSRNNVRAAQTKEGELLPTPNYNASILEDMDLEKRSTVGQSLILSSRVLQEAIILLKVWLRQRNLYDRVDTLNGFVLSMFIVHLNSAAGGQRIGNMTSLQIFRVVLDIIAKENMLGPGSRLQLENTKKQASSLEVEADLLFLDSGGSLNMTFRMTKSALAEVKYASEHTLAAMKTSPDDLAFAESFLRKLDFSVAFDYQVSFMLADCSPFLNDGTVEEKMERILCSALRDRIKIVRVQRRSFTSGWNPAEALDKFIGEQINIGLVLNSYDTAFRMVDVGPSADQKEESKIYRSFWGKKAELRRFKDGSICETVAWECEPWERHRIISRICKYILSQHFSVPDDNVEVVSDQLDFVLLDGSNGDAISSTPKILQALELFTTRMKELNLPLKVTSVQALSSACRHAAVFPPRPNTNLSVFFEPLDVMIQLEGSGRWPNDPIAIQKTKLAFCLKIADSAQKQWGARSLASEDAVDILMNGFAFRLHLFYEKDAPKVQKGAGPLDAVSWTLVTQSMHSSMLNGLHGRFPCYGPTVRLAKRWISAHLFSDVVSEETVELLVAYVFVHPHPLPPPCNRVNGFLRSLMDKLLMKHQNCMRLPEQRYSCVLLQRDLTCDACRFLRLLTEFNWEFSPLIVDINGDISADTRNDILACFNSARKGERAEAYGGLKNGPAMFIATSYDTQSICWTKHSPSKPTLKRLVAYAKSSQGLLSSIINGEHRRWQSLFRTPLTHYTAVIQLQKNSLPYPGRVLFPVELDKPAVVTCPALSRANLCQVVVGFNPVVEFIKELKASFGHLFDFWYDHLGGDVIGLTSKTSEAAGSKRKLRSSDLVPTMQQIAQVGTGLVYQIYLI